MYIYDLPEVVHDHEVVHGGCNTYCKDCGGTTCYADDATYTVAGVNPPEIIPNLNKEI